MQFYPTYNNIETSQSIKFQKILFWGFAYTIACGILRKWVFFMGAISNVLLFGQLLLPLILAWQFSKIKGFDSKRYAPVILIYCFILAFMAINPLNQTIFHGLFGFIIHAGFFCVLFAYFNNVNIKLNINQLDIFLILILIGETILATIQYSLPSEHILNRYAVDNIANAANIGDKIRTTGTFSYLGGFGTMVLFYACFAWSLLSRKNVKLFITVACITLYCCLLNGGRGPFFTCLIIILLAVFENRVTVKKHLKSVAVAAIFVLLLFVVFNSYINSAWNNWETRTTELKEGGEQSNRIYRQLFSAFIYHGDQPVFGAGLGSDYQGANAVFGLSETRKAYGYMEEEVERVVFEGGYILLLIKIILMIVVLSSMQIKWISKFILFLLLSYMGPVFNTYMIFFLAMGFIWINQSKISNTQTQTICKT